MRTQDWHDWRREGIGSSDIAAIVGLSPWRSPYALWAEKVGLVDGEIKDDDNLEFGKRIEPVLARWFEDRTGLHALGEQTMCSHPDRPWMRCTVDFFVAESAASALEDCLGVGETKTTGQSVGDWEADLPDYYRCQGQWLMAVTGYNHVWLPTLHVAFGRREFRVHELARDEGDVTFLTKEAERFWIEHVLAGVAPDVDASDATTKALKAAWKGQAGTVVDLSEQADLVGEWKHAKYLAKNAERDVDELENELRALMADATEGMVDGQLVVSWRPRTFKRIDAKALAAAMPDVAAEFTNTTTTRVLYAHEPKGKKSA